MTSSESLDSVNIISPNRVLDTNHLLSLFGDISLVCEFGEIVVAELPQQIDLLKRHIFSSNIDEIHKSAHKLKSTLGWFNYAPSLFNLNLLESVTMLTPLFVCKELFFKLEFDVYTLLFELEQHLL